MEYGGMFGSLVEYVGDSEVSSIRLSSFLYLLRRMNYSYCLDLASRDFCGGKVDTNQMMVFVTAIVEISTRGELVLGCSQIVLNHL